MKIFGTYFMGYFVNKIVFLALISQGVLLAQDDLKNHKKYWYYKSRLHNDFMKVGNTPTHPTNLSDPTGHGESVPFNERHSLDGINNLSYDSRQSVDMKEGDALTRLGIYLSVLATEYKLLDNNGQNLDKVRHEIFCAMNAINRIDYHAEPALDNTKSPSLNGFLMRSDIPRRFVIDNYKHFNYYNYKFEPADSSYDRGFTQTYNQRLIRCNGSFPSSVHEFSQDHAYYLLMGLTLVSKLVGTSDTDGSNVFGYGSGETSLVTEAKKMAERLITYLKSDPGWVLRNPNTNNPVAAGAYAMVYSYALDNLGCFIKHNQSLPTVHIPFITNGYAFPHAASWDFRNAYSASPSSPMQYHTMVTGLGGALTPDQAGFFQILGGAGNNVYENQMFLNTAVQALIADLQNMINEVIERVAEDIQEVLDNLGINVPQWLQQAAMASIAALQLSSQAAINFLNQQINTQLQLLFPSALLNTTDARLYMNSTSSQTAYYNNCINTVMQIIKQGGSEMYFGTYLRDVLHGYSIALPTNFTWIGSQPGFSHSLIKNTVENILHDAPPEANYHYGLISGGYPAGAHWGTSCFIDRVDRLWTKTSCPEFRGDYSGLDYMLLHNLYYLVEGTNHGMEDYIDRPETISYPFPDNRFSHSNKLTKGSFEYLRVANTISSNGAVNFRTGKEISMQPGFSADQGSDISLEISPYTDSGVNNNMNRASGSGTTSVTDDFYNGSSTPPKQVSTEVKQEQTDKSLSQVKKIIEEQKNKIDREFEKIMETIRNYNKIEVYPNPNAGKFIIEFKLNNEDNINIEIVNMLGDIVFRENHIVGSYALPVDLTNLAKGVYIAKMKFTTGKEEIRKISIQ